jgi:hypothetical protein
MFGSSKRISFSSRTYPVAPSIPSSFPCCLAATPSPCIHLLSKYPRQKFNGSVDRILLAPRAAKASCHKSRFDLLSSINSEEMVVWCRLMAFIPLAIEWISRIWPEDSVRLVFWAAAVPLTPWSSPYSSSSIRKCTPPNIIPPGRLMEASSPDCGNVFFC